MLKFWKLIEPNVLPRLTKVAGKKTTIQTHYGRKTGKPYEVTIWFVLDGERLYMGTANVFSAEQLLSCCNQIGLIQTHSRTA